MQFGATHSFLKAAALGLAIASLRLNAAAIEVKTVQAGVQVTVGEGRTVVFFVMTDCPVSNRFAPEIERICADYEDRGAGCLLAYVDPGITAGQASEHEAQYGLTIPATLDPEQRLVELSGATITPEAALFDGEEVVYLGRINNFYAALGRSRRQATVHDLRDALDAVIAGREVAHPRTQAIGCYIPPKGLAPTHADDHPGSGAAH